MQYDKIEKVRKQLFKELDPKDSKHIRHIKSIIVAYYVAEDTARAKAIIKLSNVDKDKLTKYMDSLNTNLNGSNYFKKLLIEQIVYNPKIFQTALKIEHSELVNYMLNADIPDSTITGLNMNSGLAKLIVNLLDIKDNCSVANFSSSSGIFEIHGIKHTSHARFTAFENINSVSNLISHIRRLYQKFKYDIVNTSEEGIFATPNTMIFDRIFTFAPLGLQAKSINNDFLSKIIADNPSYKNSNLAEWFYVLKTLKHLAPNGKAVVLLSSGATWNTLDIDIRKDLINQNVIESVISLPEKIITGINHSTTLLVLKRNSKNINMVDATNIFTSGRRTNILEDDDIVEIEKALENNNNNSAIINIKQIRTENYNLTPLRYTKSNNLTNTVPLKSLLISEISRGKSINAKQLDNLSAENSSKNYYYLTLSNIKYGFITDNLMPISKIDSNIDKYVLNFQDIVISKSYPFNIAVMGNSYPPSSIIVNNNMFIVKLELSKINPYYLKAYLESEVGQKELRRAASGTTTNIISKEQLENLQIPLKSMEEQSIIANEYQAIEDNLKTLRKKIDVLTSSLKDVWR